MTHARREGTDSMPQSGSATAPSVTAAFGGTTSPINQTPKPPKGSLHHVEISNPINTPSVETNHATTTNPVPNLDEGPNDDGILHYHRHHPTDPLCVACFTATTLLTT